ncbi:P-type conjugative transfer protein TrbL, partial [Achromobacter xylosoxidans]
MFGRGRYFTLWLVVMGALASFVFVGDALAQNLQDPSGTYTGLLDLIRNNAANWDDRLRGYATRLFWMLALIQFIWTFFPLVFRQADFGEIVGELIRFVLVIGFFAALLMYSREWAQAVVDSFRQAGASAAGLGDKALKPGDMFGTAVELANTVGNAETWNPLTATMIALAGVVVLLCFAFIAAFMGLTIIESYVVINASVMFMGLGASQWTREYAIAIMRYALSVGAKLFVLTLLVGLVITSAKQWQAAYNQDSASMWTMVGLSLVCAYLSKTIPDLVQGIITGSSMGGGAALGSMAAAGAAGAAAAIATIATAGAAAPAAGALGAGGA